MTNKPSVNISVIVPFFNSERTLENCLNSLINQIALPDEIILIDDGSTDDSLSIANAFKIQYPKQCLVLSQKNAGPSAARNLGLDHAHCKYISFIDSDDEIDKTMLDKMFQSALNNDSDIVICGRIAFDVHSKREIKRQIPAYDAINGSLVDHPELVKRTGNLMCDKLFRNSIIQNNHIRFREDIRHAEDFLFISQFRLHINRTSTVREPLYFYYLNSGKSLSSSNKFITDIPLACLEIIKEYERAGLFEITKPYLQFVFLGYYLRKCRDCNFFRHSTRLFRFRFQELFNTYFKSTWKKALKKRAYKMMDDRQAKFLIRKALCPYFLSKH